MRKASASRHEPVSSIAAVEAANQDHTMHMEETLDGQLHQNSVVAPLLLARLGPLTLLERQQKILRFITKKSQKSLAKKFTYECRKQVAEKRLRIKGRFVTKL